MSTISSFHQTLKIHGKVQLASDIIFLSDIRLGKRSDERCISLLSKMFLTNPYGSYDFYYNSTMSNRGVGILIKKNLNVSVLAEARDNSENILALRIRIQDSELVLCCVYGPNKLCSEFFEDLDNIFSNAKLYPIVAGGIGTVLPPVIP